MDRIKVVNLIEKVENITCIYRNYKFCGNTKKRFICIRLVFELLFYLFAYVNCCYGFLIEEDISRTEKILYIGLYGGMYISDVLFVVYGIQKMENYKIFLTNLMTIHNGYIENPNYINRSKHVENVFLISFMAYLFISIFLFALEIACNILLDASSLTLTRVWVFWTGIHYSLEYSALYAFISLLTNLLKCLNESLSAIHLLLKRKPNNIVSQDVVQTEPSTISNEIKLWIKQYDYTVNCRKQLAACFEYQIMFSISSVSLGYIVIAYVWLQMILEEDIIYGIAILITWEMVFCMYFMGMVFNAGQKLQNETTAMNRSVSRLYCILSMNPNAPETKMAKNLLTLTTTKPVDLKLFKAGMGLYLIPVIFSIIVTHAIIALQFNNVI